MTKESRPLRVQGGNDDFGRIDTWDASLAESWANALDKRATNPDQVLLRAALFDMARIGLGQTIVDMGCGTGSLMLELASAVGAAGKVIGIEPQPGLASVAQRRIAESGLAERCHVRIERGSVTSLNSAIADVCIAQTVLLHLPEGERNATLARMIELTKRGGCVISSDQDADTWVIDHPDQELTRRIVACYGEQSFADGWMGRKQRRAFLDAGLKSVEVRVIPMVDTSADSFAFGRAVSRAQVASKTGWITDEEQRRWLATLNQLATAGQFFTSTNYYLTIGYVDL